MHPGCGMTPLPGPSMQELPTAVPEALHLLSNELQLAPCVARSSIIMGVLQEHLFVNGREQRPLQDEVMSYMHKFQQLLVEPAAARIGKCKKPQDKVIAIAKFLRSKLAKAPAHKQPLHTQYLPSALRDSGKRQLDCLGIATAVLALCHHISQQQPVQHADLASSSMVVSDDHCWLSLPADGAGPDLQIEVTDPRELQSSQTANWLYAGGNGIVCSSANVVMMLVAGMMPEELKDDDAASYIRLIQMHLLQQLAQQHPGAMFYSNYFRWGMLHEEQELEQLAASAESQDMQALQLLALLSPQHVQSQQYYQHSQQCSTGWQWHPSSCAAFGWLNRMQAALCGNTDTLLALQPTAPAAMRSSNTAPQQQLEQHLQQSAVSQAADTWLHVSRFLLQQALVSVQDCTQVLRKYSGCAGKPDKAADQQLLEAVTDLWQNLADACKAVACLQQLQGFGAAQQQAEAPEQLRLGGEQISRDTADAVNTAGTAAGPSPARDAASSRSCTDSKLHAAEQLGLGRHGAADVPTMTPVAGHTVHLATAVRRVNSQLKQTEQLTESSWLQTQLCFLDAVCDYYGDESTDLPASIVSYFADAASTFTRSARAEAIARVELQLCSSRLKALADACSPHGFAWLQMGVDLQQLLLLLSSRKRKRREL